MTQFKSLLLLTINALLVITVMFAFSPVVLAADAYPSKPIRLIIPFPPGGSNDIFGRLIATKLSERLGVQVVPENKGGAGGVLGAEIVAKSAPDGYTLLIIAGGHVVNPSLYELPYDHYKAFLPIAKIASGPHALTVYPGLPANSVKELIALAKQQPGKLICATSGIGSFMHLVSELFKHMAGIDIKIVPFKGGSPAAIDTMGGHSQISMGTLAQSLSFIKAGKLKPLGVSGKKRSSLLPDLPTIAEAGVPGYDATNWWGVVGPAAMPKAIADRLYKELSEIMKMADTQKMFMDQGADVDVVGFEEFGQFINAETEKWGKVVKQANIKVQ